MFFTLSHIIFTSSLIFDYFIKTYPRVRLSMTADVTQRIVLCFVSVKHQVSKASGHTYLWVWYPPHAHSMLLILSTFNSFSAQVFYHVFNFSHIKPLYLPRKFHNGTIYFSFLRFHSHWGPEETGHVECLQKPSSWETQRYAPKDSDRSKYVDCMGLSS